MCHAQQADHSSSFTRGGPGGTASPRRPLRILHSLSGLIKALHYGRGEGEGRTRVGEGKAITHLHIGRNRVSVRAGRPV